MKGEMQIKELALTWAYFGAVVENSRDTVDSMTCYMSVPSSSEFRAPGGEEICGRFLAKKLQDHMRGLCAAAGKKFSIKYRVRKEHWTRAKANLARKGEEETLKWIF